MNKSAKTEDAKFPAEWLSIEAKKPLGKSAFAWDKNQVAFIVNYYNKGYSAAQISRCIGKNASTVAALIRRLKSIGEL